MKFGHYILENAIVEWSSEYINYRALKHLACHRPDTSEDAHRAEFLFLFERELERVEGFFVKRTGIIERRLSLIKQGIESDSLNLMLFSDIQGPRLFMSNSDLPSSFLNTSCTSDVVDGGASEEMLPTVDRDSLLLEHLEECRIWVRKLSDYSKMNLEGFRKILKKYDKKHGQKTNLLESHYESQVLHSNFAKYKSILGISSNELDVFADILMKRIVGVHKDTQKYSLALEEIRKIWNDIYALQVRSILESDDTDALIQITETLHLSSKDGENPKGISEKTLVLLEREHALLLKHLLDGICLHQSEKCLEMLLNLGLDVSRNESWMNMSLLSKVLNGLPRRSQSSGSIVQDDETIYQKASAMIKTLLGYKSNPKWTDARGRNLVHQAVFAGSNSCLEALLENGSVKFYSFDHDGCSPIYFAIQSGFVDIFNSLMEAYTKNNIPLLLISSAGMEESFINVDPLIFACKQGYLELVSAIISRKMPLNVIDLDGETALFHCAKRNYSKCLQLLLENGADPEIAERYEKWTPIFVAASTGSVECVKLLCSFNAKLDSVDRQGWTAYEYSVFRGHIELARLIKPSSNINLLMTPPPSSPIINTERISPPQEYGHVILGRDKTLRLTLGHRSGPRSTKPLVELLDQPLPGQIEMQLRIWPSNPSLAEPILFDLPLRESPETISFILSSGENIFYSPWDEIRFDLINTFFDGNVIDILGRGSIVLRNFVNGDTKPTVNGSKQFIVPILNRQKMEPMALVSFEVIFASPFEHPMVKEKQSQMYWKSVSTKVIGHRGLGANSGTPRPQIGENTVLSFVMAASLGAEYVEFDVQLTRDKFPVLYHDFIVSETGLDLSVSNLTLQQFLDLRKKSSCSHEVNRSRRSTLDDISLRMSTSSINNLSSNEPSSSFRIETSFATLKEAFRKVPNNIGFNVEVKYPTQDEFLQSGMQFLFEINEYCDRILTVVFEESADRPVIFSSFHPDICLLMALKQTTFPVFFLTEGGMSKFESEPRSNSIHQAIRFAKSAHLLGIVCHSTPLVEAPRLITEVRSNGLLLFTYGPRNNDLDSVRLQTAMGVDAVIVDSVAHIRKGLS